MSIKTSKIRVQPLRGMDERWSAQPNKALKITDMVHTGQDSWKSAGGFDYAVCGYRGTEIGEDIVRTTAVMLPGSLDEIQTEIDVRVSSRTDESPADKIETYSLRKPYQFTSIVRQVETIDETLKDQKNRGQKKAGIGA